MVSADIHIVVVDIEFHLELLFVYALLAGYKHLSAHFAYIKRSHNELAVACLDAGYVKQRSDKA